MCEHVDDTLWGKALRKSLRWGGQGDDPKTVKGLRQDRRHWGHAVWRSVFLSSPTSCILYTNTYRYNVRSIDQKICANDCQQKNGIYTGFSKTIFLERCSLWLFCRCLNHWIWLLLLLVGWIQNIFWCNHLRHPIVAKDHQKHGNTHQSLGKFDWKEMNALSTAFSLWFDL